MPRGQGKRIYIVQYRLLRLNNTTHANEIKIRGPFNPFSLSAPLRSSLFPSQLASVLANEDLMETAPVPRLTDLKGTLNYLATNAVIYVVVGCLSNTEHRLVNEKSPARSRGLRALFTSIHLPSFIIICRVWLIWTSWCIYTQFSNIICHIDSRFVVFSFLLFKSFIDKRQIF